MKITLFHLLLVITFLAFVTSKGSEELNTGVSVKTRNELISRMWRVEQVLIDNVTDRTSDFRNSRFNFSKDGKYTFSRKSGKIKGSWELVKDEQKLILDKNTPDEQAVDILLISETQLYLSFTNTSKKVGESNSLYKLSF